LEPWEKVLVDGATYPNTVHGAIACTGCHGGEQAADKETAHTGLLANPSAEPEKYCGDCHPNTVTMARNSLHSTLAGYWTVLNARSTPEGHEALGEAFDNHCGSCHATCGECHVSQPNGVGGGLIAGHNFNRTPSMTRNCTACHGSRVGNEFLGKHEGIMADVHFRQGRMSCVDCHTGNEMHGAGDNCEQCHTGPESAVVPPPDHRYDGVQSPRCESCHASVTIKGSGNEMHDQHGSDLSCQVCHSVAYTSCDGCHVALSETTGKPFYATGGSYMTFLIGRNTRKSFDRPYDYVPVRHVPIAETNFTFYGPDLLPFFDALPTWAYATPHNIQRQTPQNASCDACHGQEALFLTADKVYPEELEANLPVIVGEIPAPISSTLTLTATTPMTSTLATPAPEPSP
jgi:thiosulfate/3-mercaptopyruvate sulfurtransferase